MRLHFARSAALAILASGLWPNAGVAQARAAGFWLAPEPGEASAGAVPSAGVQGRIEGAVTDDHGNALEGVAVTAHGSDVRFAVTNRQGKFFFSSLPLGPYYISARLPGFVASNRELVYVRSARATVSDLRLRSSPRAVLEAGMVAGQEDEPDAGGPVGESDHGESATVWRIRHLKRSVLRDLVGGDAGTETSKAEVAETETLAALSLLDRDLFSAQVQFLSISAFDTPQDLLATGRIPRGVAYITLTAPVGPDGLWAIQGAMTEGDVSSWVLGGNYTTTIAGRHATEVGMSYAAQRYDGGNPLALSAMSETSRTVGALHAFDRWSLTPAMSIRGGARFAHHGYIDSAGLLSPSLEWRWQFAEGQTVRASVSQQMVAPGAEEFVPSPVAGMWMPPQRTFSSLIPSHDFRAERARHFEVGFEQDVASFVIATQGFRELVDNQIVTIFGLRQADQPRSDLGHYFTATAGDVEMSGWGVTVSRPVASRVRGSVWYAIARANWLTSPESDVYAALAGSAARTTSERIHDLTTSIETDIPETATRVVALYKLNSGYTQDDGLQSTPGLSGRFDVQVTQRLPFIPVGQTEWEVLVAVRNLFLDAGEGASFYDELLVVRPPKRLVGGLTIRF